MRFARRDGVVNAGWALGAAALALCVAAWAMRLWRADFGTLLQPGGDATWNAVLVKSTLAHGWYLHVPELGAPFGLRMNDFAGFAGDTLSVLAIKGLGLFTSSPAVVVNVYYLAGFALVGGVAFLVLRRLGLSVGPSLVAALLYALLPTHFEQGDSHLFLGAYVSVPVGCYLAMRVFGGRFGRRTWVAVGVACVLIGLLGTYYAVFTMLLVLVCGLFAAATGRDVRLLIAPAAIIAVIGAVSAAEELPTLIYRARHGTNLQVGQRQPFEAELYGLRIGDLILPPSNDRIRPLAHLGQRYLAQKIALSTSNESKWATLGLVGSAGFLLLLAAGLRRMVAGVRGPPSLVDKAAFATWVATIAALSGGFALVFSLIVSPEIRVWSRISVFIGFFAMLAVALALDAALARWFTRGWRWRAGGLALLAAVLLFGLFEQTNDGPLFTPPYGQNAAIANSERTMVAAIERRLPKGAAVWQLPYTSFPEAPPLAAESPYDQLIPYVYSHTLSWSGGAMRGRPQDWQAQMQGVALARELRGVVAAGFAGALVDRRAYADNGTGVVAELTRLAGPSPIQSADGRWVFFDLRPSGRSLGLSPGARAALAAATVTPLRLEFGPGFALRGPPMPPRTDYPANLSARLDLVNPLHAPAAAILSARLASGSGTGAVDVQVPGRAAQWLPVSQAGTPWQVRLVLPPGRSEIEFQTTLTVASGSGPPFRLVAPVLVRPEFGLP